MKPPLRPVLYGIGLLLAFGTGRWLKPVTPPESAGSISPAAFLAKPSGPPKPHPSTANRESDWADAVSAELRAIREAGRPGGSNPLLMAKLEAALMMGDRTIGEPLWETLLTAITPADAPAVQELFRRQAKAGRYFTREFERFCYRWGQVDGGTAAQKILSEHAGNSNIVTGVMSGWGNRDAAAALAWAKQQPGLVQGTAIAAVISGLGNQSAREAEALILSDPDNPLFKPSIGKIARMRVAQEGLEAALPWFDNIAGGSSPDHFKQANLDSLLAIMNQGADTDRAITLTKRYSSEAWLPASAGGVIGLALAGTDPALGLNELGAMASKEAQTSAARILLDQWGTEATSEWLVANAQHSVFDSATLWLVENLTKSDPEAAAAWANQIKDPPMRSLADSMLKRAAWIKKSRQE